MREVAELSDLLDLLRADPLRRAVVSNDDGERFVCICKYGDLSYPIRPVLASVCGGTAAGAALNQAVDADLQGDRAAWEALPLRYGPDGATWVLPEHPQAKRQPGQLPSDK